MKHKFIIKGLIAIVAITLQLQISFAQWLNQPFGTGINFQRLHQNSRAVVIGNYGGPLCPNNVPLSALDINTNCLNPAISFTPSEVFRSNSPMGQHTFWRMLRGGAEIGNIFSQFSLTPIVNNNFSLQANQQDITFHTRPLAGNNIGQERTRIVGVGRILFPANAITAFPVTPGNVGIGTQSPVSMLQIGTNIMQGGGYRDWMNVGSLYNHGTDNMYVGLRRIGTDRHDAIINWGNNPIPLTEADRLRFVFTSPTGGPQAGFPAGVYDGLEIARMVSDGNNGFVGIGDFLTAGFEPYHRLTIMHDEMPVLGIVNDKPQNDTTNMRIELALALQAGYFSNLAQVGDGHGIFNETLIKT